LRVGTQRHGLNLLPLIKYPSATKWAIETSKALVEIRPVYRIGPLGVPVVNDSATQGAWHACRISDYWSWQLTRLV